LNLEQKQNTQADKTARDDIPLLDIVVLISGSGSNLQSIIDAVNSKQISARIKAVFSNKKEAYGLQRAADAGIPCEVIEHHAFPDRQSFDQQLMRTIDSYQPQLVVLAGFMRILTDDFVAHYENRMINIHPSLLPKYRGLHTHRRALKAGDTEHGLSIHYVSSELDGGPLITQVKVPILADDSEETLAQRVLQQEHIAYPRVIQEIAKKHFN